MKNQSYLVSYLFVLSLIFISTPLIGQDWNDLTYNADQPGLERNPLKGFATMFNGSNDFPHTIQGRLFGLDEIMFGLDNFDWSPIDNFIAQEASEGNHCYIQVNIDPADGTRDMPLFLQSQVDWQPFTSGSAATNDLFEDDCPDWNDPDLMEAMLNFVDSFGVKYNNDERVYLVHQGLYGLWGEWHIGDVEFIRPEFVMTEQNRLILADAFALAFPDKHLLARYPEHMPDAQEFGYSDGLFFKESISADIDFYFHNTLKIHQADENWKLYPIGGELAPSLQPTIWQDWPNVVGQDVVQSFDSIRPTWIFAHHNFTDIQTNSTEWDNAIRAQKLMGYTFYIDQYKLTATNGMPAIEVNVQNKGLAPMYANWDVEFAAINSNGDFLNLDSTKWNLDLIQPDGLNNYRSYISETTLVDGTYTFLLRIINPMEAYSNDASAIQFANSTQDIDSTGWLTLGNATITSGSLGTIPEKVTGISLSPTIDTLVVGETLQLTATVLPATATNTDITWTSDHPRTASVDENGFVQALPRFGSTIISAYTQDGAFIASCQILVEPVRVNIPALIEAEDFIWMAGVEFENNNEGTQSLSFIDDSDWMQYGVIVDSLTTFTIDYRYASKNGGGKLAVVNEKGDTLDVIDLPSTTEWFIYETITSNPIFLPKGEQNLKLIAVNGGFNFNWLEFKYETPMPTSFTFLGTTDDQFSDGSNWDAGIPPPSGYNGTININADCKRQEKFRLGSNGTMIVADGVELSLE